MNHSEIVSFLWSGADLIRDTFRRGKYQDSHPASNDVSTSFICR